MGAEISYDRVSGIFHVIPIRESDDVCSMDVGESGSTLRFLLPVVCALGLQAHIVMHGRLADRPLSPSRLRRSSHGFVSAAYFGSEICGISYQESKFPF
jgi:3-phosphoshikimate 1-carboxyvinyltransferase